MRRAALAVALAACSEPAASSQPAWPEKPPEPVVDARLAEARADEIAPPAECGRQTWGQCLEAARSLVEQTPGYQEEGVALYKLLCAEGDRRRCFDGDLTEDRGCHVDGLVFACYELAGLYRDGKATCPDDDRCADLLFLMACRGGETRACAQ
jgi:hypothetical protein